MNLCAHFVAEKACKLSTNSVEFNTTSTDGAQFKGGIILKKTIGEILRELRGNKTQEEISEELGVTKSSWAMYERNERVPRDEVKVKIARHFNKTVQEIFFCNT